MKQLLQANTIATIVAIAAISAPFISSADEGDLKGKTVKVTFADLDVKKEQGAHVLYRRLQHASKRACDVESVKNAGSIRAVSDAYRCYRQTLTAQVKKIDNEILTRIHEG